MLRYWMLENAKCRKNVDVYIVEVNEMPNILFWLKRQNVSVDVPPAVLERQIIDMLDPHSCKNTNPKEQREPRAFVRDATAICSDYRTIPWCPK